MGIHLIAGAVGKRAIYLVSNTMLASTVNAMLLMVVVLRALATATQIARMVVRWCLLPTSTIAAAASMIARKIWSTQDATEASALIPILRFCRRNRACRGPSLVFSVDYRSNDVYV
jgi:hypothetical protein